MAFFETLTLSLPRAAVEKHEKWQTSWYPSPASSCMPPDCKASVLKTTPRTSSRDESCFKACAV